MEQVMEFVLVLVVDICVAASISVLYATGLRMWARGAVPAGTGGHITYRLASAMCFAACVVIVLVALWLMIPIFH